MITGIKQTATVQPGGIVEVYSPELTPGALERRSVSTASQLSHLK